MKQIWNATALLIGLSLALSVNAFAQDSERPVKMKELPEAVRKAVQEQSKGAILRGLAKEIKDGNTYYEAELNVRGHRRDVLMDPSGAVVEIEEEVALASLPAEVQATIKKGAGKGKIFLVESITRNNAVEAYEAHVSTAGKQTEIKVSPEGRLISVEEDQDENERKWDEQRRRKRRSHNQRFWTLPNQSGNQLYLNSHL